MANEHTRVTVVGTYRSVDIALPSLSPIGEYTPRLAEICGQEGSDQLPPVWSLARADTGPFALDTGLLQAGVVDGEVLYLYDLASGPMEVPDVKDIDEVVAEETEHLRRGNVHAGPVILTLGLTLLIAAAVLLSMRYRTDTGAAVGLTVTGMILLGTAWGLRQRDTAVPAGLVLTVALTAVPCLAVAGLLIARGLGGSDWAWGGAAIGANTAMLMAIAMLPEPLFFAVELSLLAGGLTIALTAGLEADGVESAAIAATVAAGMLALSRRLAALITAWMPARPIPELVHSSARILPVVLAGPVLTLAVALPVLAVSGRAFAVILAVFVCTAVAARARGAAFTTELYLLGGAATIGVFGLLVAAARTVATTGTSAAAILLGAGLLVVAAGVAMSVFIPPAKPHGPGPKPPIRRSRAEALGVVAAITIAPLTLGVFGVFGHLMMVGRTLF
ncbi:type VII secretion integral membrane protein EccD [Paractinoplanes ferrugineus]|uniref:Type VII secretion integral membrane protein EccD n=1 Tax=Paractinoplanes ferrugineus TaxID=113564 RepID=A0A919MQV2_9ACTN|nr:EsaB/YukD family protein [Actinoplanes ferrugineus]GIE16712.1 type VII secretion integral membrane protein EccD [Actinoplanes ferrugineus]